MLLNKKSSRSFSICAVVVFLLTFATSNFAQTNERLIGNGSTNLVSAVRTGTLSAAEINKRSRKLFGNSIAPARQALDLYKITYRSRDEKNRAAILSGLVALPRGGALSGLVIFNHGTIVNSALAPSRFTAKTDKSEAGVAIAAFASGGYALAMPDYLGLGDHKGAHPYPLAALNSLSAIDIIEAARTLAARERTNVGKPLFISGYSEGGATAMWTLRELERKSGANYEVTAAAPASGPYDLSDTTRRWMLAAPTDQQDFVIRLYLVSYMAYYFHKSTGVKLIEFFKPAMALTVSQAFKGNVSDENIIKRLAIAAVLMRSKNSLANVLTPRFLKSLQTLDTYDPVIREMQKSDTYDWSPRTKTLLISLQGDKVVDPANTEKTFRTMRRRGVTAQTLRRYLITDPKLDHITAISAALAQTRLFFDGNFAGSE